MNFITLSILALLAILTFITVQAGPPTLNQLYYPYDQTDPMNSFDIYCNGGTCTGTNHVILAASTGTGCNCATGLDCVQADCPGCTTQKFCYNKANGIISNAYYVGLADVQACYVNKTVQVAWTYGPGTPFYWRSYACSSWV